MTWPLFLNSSLFWVIIIFLISSLHFAYLNFYWFFYFLLLLRIFNFQSYLIATLILDFHLIFWMITKVINMNKIWLKRIFLLNILVSRFWFDGLFSNFKLFEFFWFLLIWWLWFYLLRFFWLLTILLFWLFWCFFNNWFLVF